MQQNATKSEQQEGIRTHMGENQQFCLVLLNFAAFCSILLQFAAGVFFLRFFFDSFLILFWFFLVFFESVFDSFLSRPVLGFPRPTFFWVLFWVRFCFPNFFKDTPLCVGSWGLNPTDQQRYFAHAPLIECFPARTIGFPIYPSPGISSDPDSISMATADVEHVQVWDGLHDPGWSWVILGDPGWFLAVPCHYTITCHYSMQRTVWKPLETYVLWKPSYCKGICSSKATCAWVVVFQKYSPKKSRGISWLRFLGYPHFWSFWDKPIVCLSQVIEHLDEDIEHEQTKDIKRLCSSNTCVILRDIATVTRIFGVFWGKVDLLLAKSRLYNID